MRVYEYCVFYSPKNDDNAKIIVPVKQCLAADEKAATLKAAREITVEYETKLEDCKVLVRPF